MEPKIGQSVHFWRDRDFPGKRGPYPARVVAIVHLAQPGSPDGEEKESNDSRGLSTVNLTVIGEGGEFTEYNIPFLTDEFGEPGTRYCSVVS